MSSLSTRRTFLKSTALAGAAVSMTARSYARVPGANDRISIGIIGCGQRGAHAHMPGIHTHAKAENVEITAVCDPWRQKREAAAAKCKEWYGAEARQFVSYQDLLALNDVDAVTIGSCDHQHTAHLAAAAEAKKDVYVEKPLGKDLAGVIKACDAAVSNGIVVQVGTQLRSMGSMAGARERYQTGVLGKVSRIEQCRNAWRPYWYSHIAPVEEADVDWNEFLMDLPPQPFNADRYSGWYGYRETSDGPIPGFASHFLDLVHYITGARFPVSCVCQGGTFTWNDEHGFTAPDHVQATWIYPEGFLVSYSTNFGNGSGNTFKIFGDRGVLDLVDWNDPMLTGEGAGPQQACVSEPERVAYIERPDHMLDWLRCIRSRETTHAPITAGYQHAVAVLMAVQSYDTGRRTLYDPESRTIREG